MKTLKETFSEYLLRQVLRWDPVGDIAREVNDDPDWPSHVRDIDAFHRYLNTHHAPEAAHDALDAAWAEYRNRRTS